MVVIIGGIIWYNKNQSSETEEPDNEQTLNLENIINEAIITFQEASKLSMVNAYNYNQFIKMQTLFNKEKKEIFLNVLKLSTNSIKNRRQKFLKQVSDCSKEDKNNSEEYFSEGALGKYTTIIKNILNFVDELKPEKVQYWTKRLSLSSEEIMQMPKKDLFILVLRSAEL